MIECKRDTEPKFGSISNGNRNNENSKGEQQNKQEQNHSKDNNNNNNNNNKENNVFAIEENIDNNSFNSIALEPASTSQEKGANLASIKQLILQILGLRSKEQNKLDNLEAMINDDTLKLLQQRELLHSKHNNSLQLDQLCKDTRFSRRELKWLYTGWKVACTDGCGVSTDLEGCESLGSHSLSSAYYGIINENQFQQIYAQFFPYGGDCSFYAKYVYQAMFGHILAKNGGFITFADYARALSSLLRGSIEDKIGFVFRLYDLNGDNVLTLDEMERIFNAVYKLLGDNVNKKHDQETYEQEANKFYKKLDEQDVGHITRQQFVDFCLRDPNIVDTIRMLEMSICSKA